MFSRETHALMEAAVDAVVVIDRHGVIAAANDATCRMFGYRADELLGEKVNMLMSTTDRGTHDGYMQRHRDTGEAKIIGIGREVTAQRKNGTTFPVHLSVGQIRGEPRAYVGIMRDVSVQQATMAALKLERDRANAYLELNDAILLQLDVQRKLIDINNRGSMLLGAPSAELLGRDWLDFFRGDEARAQARVLLESALGTISSREREFEAVDAVGAPRHIHWRVIALRDVRGEPAGWLCAGADITSQVLREEDSRLAQDRFTRVARLATMGEMAAGVAHELNQPLTAITTYARACERYLGEPQPDFPALREAVQEIGAEGLRAGEIIRRVRRLARHSSTVRRPTQLNDLVEELKVLLQADARVHDTALRIDTAAHLPRVDVDGVQIQQVILNLVRNAFEAVTARPAGSREVSVTTSVAAGGEVEFAVCDNGPGIAPEIADLMFDPFCTTKPTGSGLGLTISRTIVQAHGGIIGSRLPGPQGICFYFQLPALQGH
jgi:two-component system, LuxR family, sensor kinase FixL